MAAKKIDGVDKEIVDFPRKDRLTGAVCLRMDQLTVLRRGMRQISGQSAGGLLVDTSVRQVEIYDKTGKFPAQNKLEKKLDDEERWNRLMNIAEITVSVECFNDAIDECIKSGGRGLFCYRHAETTCKTHDLDLSKSYCEDLEKEGKKL